MPRSSSRVFLLTGPPGSGKTRKISELFLSRGDHAPGREVLVLLPDRGAVRAFRRRLLEAAGGSGFLDGGITTFEGYAGVLLGIAREDLAAPEDESLVLCALAPCLPGALADRARSPRFRGSFLRWISELRGEAIGANEIRALLEALPGRDDRLRLLADAQELFRAAEEERGLLLRDDLPARAARLIDAGGPAVRLPDLLLVDGFHRFSGARLELLASLSRAVPETWITLPSAPDTDSWSAGMLKRTHSALFERIAAEEKELEGGDEAPEPVFLGGTDRREEMERIARLILAGAAGEDRKLEDFLVLFRETDPYRAVLGSVFRSFGIPYRGRFQAAAVSTAPGRSLLDSLAIARLGVTRETVDAYLKNQMFAVDPDLSDRILRTWIGKPEPVDGEALFREMAEADRGFATERIEPLVRFVGEVRGGKGGDVVRILRDSWLEWIGPSLHAAAFPREDLPLVGSAVARLVSLLDRAAATFDREPPLSGGSPAGLFDLLEEEIARARVMFVEGEGGVRIDDFRHGQNLRAPVVFLAGLEAGLCPRAYDPGSFWTESDRDRLNASGQYRVPDRSLHTDEERYLFRRACTRATERLYLTAPSFQPNGKACAESPFRSETRREIGEGGQGGQRERKAGAAGPGGRSARDLGPVERFGSPDAIASPSDLLPFLASRADPAERDRRGIVLAAALLARAGYEAPPLPRSFRDPVRLGETRAFPAWLRRRREFSVTELEDFQACPYRYFARYVLSLREPEEEIDHAFPIVVEGTVLHRVLEESKGDAGSIDDLVSRALEEARGPFAERLAHRLAEEDLRGSLRALVAEDLAFREAYEWTPHAFEYTFGSDAKRPVRAGDAVAIRGRIDRIDVAISGELLVVDYKRSAARKGEVERFLAEGQSLALPLYLVAASELLGRRGAGAFLLGARETRRSGFYDLSLAEKGIVPERKRAGSAMALEPSAFADTIEQASLQASRAAEEIATGEFPVEPADQKVCGRLHCPYRDLCRIVHAAAEEEESE